MRRVLAATFLLAALATPGAAQMRAMRSSAPMRPFGRPSMGLSRPMGMRPVFGSRPAFTPLGPRTSFRREGFASFSHHGPIFVHRPFFPRHHRVFFSTFPFGSPYLLGASIYPYPSDYPYLADYPGVYASDTSAYQQSSDDSYNRLSSQLDQLNSQMQLLRDQNESLRSDMERQQQRTREQASTPPEAPQSWFFAMAIARKRRTTLLWDKLFGFSAPTMPQKFLLRIWIWTRPSR